MTEMVSETRGRFWRGGRRPTRSGVTAPLTLRVGFRPGFDYNPGMEAHLPPELERWADEMVAAGRFASRGDVICAAMRLLQDHESLRDRELAGLSAAIQEGLDDLDAGRSQVFDQALIDRIKAEGRQRLAEQESQRQKRRA